MLRLDKEQIIHIRDEARHSGFTMRNLTLLIAAGVGLGGPLRLLRVDSLRVGSSEAINLTVCSLDLRSLQHVSPGARGLLGLNFLKSFRVNIDFNRRVLQLAAP